MKEKPLIYSDAFIALACSSKKVCELIRNLVHCLKRGAGQALGRVALCLAIFCSASMSQAFAQSPETATNTAANADSQGDGNTVASNTSTLLDQAIDHAFDHTMIDIENAMFEDEYVRLSTQIDGEDYPFAMLSQASQRSVTTGTVYLIADGSQNGRDFASLTTMANELNRYGWHTLIIPAPSILKVTHVVDAKLASAQGSTGGENQEAGQAIQGNENTETASPAEENNDIEATQAPQLHFNARHHQNQVAPIYHKAFEKFLASYIETAANSDEAQQGYQVVFAKGLSAHALSSLLAGDDPQASLSLTIDALVTNNLFWPERDLNTESAKFIAKIQAPVLDLIGPYDNKWSQFTRHQRQIESIRRVKTHYRQRDLSLDTYGSHLYSNFAREMHAYFSYLGW